MSELLRPSGRLERPRGREYRSHGGFRVMAMVATPWVAGFVNTPVLVVAAPGRRAGHGLQGNPPASRRRAAAGRRDQGTQANARQPGRHDSTRAGGLRARLRRYGWRFVAARAGYDLDQREADIRRTSQKATTYRDQGLLTVDEAEQVKGFVASASAERPDPVPDYFDRWLDRSDRGERKKT